MNTVILSLIIYIWAISLILTSVAVLFSCNVYFFGGGLNVIDLSFVG